MKEVNKNNQSSKNNNISSSNEFENSYYNEISKKQLITQINEVCIFDFDVKELILEEALNEIDNWTFYT